MSSTLIVNVRILLMRHTSVLTNPEPNSLQLLLSTNKYKRIVLIYMRVVATDVHMNYF